MRSDSLVKIRVEVVKMRLREEGFELLAIELF